MEAQKVFIRPDKTAVLTCPHCSKSRTITMEKLPNKKHLMKVKCTCTSVFAVRFEFRKKFRKEANLEGFYLNLTVLAAAEKEQGAAAIARYGGDTLKEFNCRIKNLSRDGLGFLVTAPGPMDLEPAHELEIKFTLDNASQAEVVKRAVVRAVSNNYVGCEFTSWPGQNDTALGFYLL